MGAWSVFATSQVTVCVAFGSQVVAVFCDVIIKGPETSSTVTITLSDAVAPPSSSLSRTVTLNSMVLFTDGTTSHSFAERPAKTVGISGIKRVGDKVEELQDTLKEYKDTIGFLREKLNEVNLLNAKLLFTNKLFRGFGLNNNQKLSVVEQFDRTKNLREIKLVYTTLAESFKGDGSKRVNESKGQASKAVQSTAPKKEVISEGAEMKNRFKKLANLV